VDSEFKDLYIYLLGICEPEIWFRQSHMHPCPEQDTNPRSRSCAAVVGEYLVSQLFRYSMT